MTQPNEARYQALLDGLRDATHCIAKAATDDADGHKARLEAGYAAIRYVVLYLAADSDVRAGGLLRPLAIAENALRDVAQGAKPALLDHKTAGPAHKPTKTTRESVQGGAAAALYVLTQALWGTAKAAEWVAVEARRAQLFCVNGNAITAAQIKNWYSEINKRRAPTEAQECFDEFVGYERQKSWWKAPRSHPYKRSAAEDAAKKIILTLAQVAPRSAPPRTGRAI